MAALSNNEKARQDTEELNRTVDSLDQENLPPANIMVAGITGTGKSTLVNAVFRNDFAETGKGRPVTSDLQRYESPDIPIRIWDTVGLELDSATTERSIRDIRNVIAEMSEKNDHFDRIHAIWYCVNSGSSRYQGAELKFIKALHDIGVPFIIVLTQCIGEPEEIDAFEKEIRRINADMGMGDIDVVQVCAQNFKLRGFTIESFGLDKLIETTTRRLPEFIKGAFIAAQQVNKAQKRERCEEIIFSYVQKAQNGFFDKVPFINLFTTDHNVEKMFRDIGTSYYKVFGEQAPYMIRILIKQVDAGLFDIIGKTFKKAWNKDEYSENIQALFEKHGVDGKNYNRIPKLLACYGYIFLDAVEQVWGELTEEQLKNINAVIDKLKEVLNEKFLRFSKIMAHDRDIKEYSGSDL